MKTQSLPLGVDIGTARLRVAHAVRQRNGRCLRAVATRDVPAGAISAGGVSDVEYVAALLEDAVAELNTAERRCIAAIGMPAASLRTLALPQMTAIERSRTARFEAARHVDYPISEAVVCLRPVDGQGRLWALGIARASAVQSKMSLLRRAGLRPLSLDDEGCAMRRAFPTFDGILDIGHHRSTLYVKGSLDAFQTQHGGAAITAGIQNDLRLDEPTAEKRKRILGTAGAGERARQALVGHLAALIHSAKHASPVRRIAVVGNGARLPHIIRDVEQAGGVHCALAVSHVFNGEPYAEDVVASSAADWTLAATLASGATDDV
ncbi:MAG TPA: pilus assembly protein PilM [Candidatus Rubrimentiphilum sp.]|nr:pilus assembly protein PilM [Candidatus Rubrimentiphilum sp.]